MPIIKSFAVGAGDMFYIRHGSDNFTIIDCDLCDDNRDNIIQELKHESKEKRIIRFICTHPDEDHFGGIHWLDDSMPINNFYVVKNQAIKDNNTDSFKRYCHLRDGDKAFYIHKGCSRKWMNKSDDEREGSGINVLWPETSNEHFIEALRACNAGESYNNTSAVIRYQLSGGASLLWLGDLETQFMEDIFDDIELEKTTIVFAAHHGRDSGKIPDSWLKKLDPQVIVIGEAPSRHLNYYTGYEILTQNSAGNITMECINNKVHFYSSEIGYTKNFLNNEGRTSYPNYFGSLTVETEYTL